MVLHRYSNEGSFSENITSTGDTRDLTVAEIEGHRQAILAIEALRAYLLGL